jgi:hypothetical protein
MSTDEVRSIKVFGGWEFLEGMINSYPKTNYIRYIAYSKDEKIIIEKYYFSKKDTPEFYNKNIDIRLDKEDDNTIMNRCAGNPPFSGSAETVAKILEHMVATSEEAKIIAPSTFVKSFAYINKFIELKEQIVDVEPLRENNFDASFASEVAIFHFKRGEKSDYWKTLLFEGTSNPELAKLIHNEFSKMEKLSDKFEYFKVQKTLEVEVNGEIKKESVYVPNPKFTPDKNKYYVGIPAVRGNRDKKSSIQKWDFYTFCPEYQGVEKGKPNSSWHCGIGFDSLKDAEDYRRYLDTDIAMFPLFLYKKHNKLLNYVNYVPYRIDINDLAERISSISDFSKQNVIDYISDEMKPYGLKAKPKKEK